MVMEPTDLANKISQLCLNFYDKLPNSKRLHKDTEWTILSAIVMQRNGCDFEIVAMGTGTKCIGANLLSANGNIINDSHAEIIARRAFMRFLLHQISIARGGNCESIFHFIQDEKHFTLRDDIKFHMFTTSSPCGDASIFATSDIIVDEPDAKRMKLINESGYQPDGFTGAKLMFDEDVEDPMDQIEGKIRIKPGKGDRTMSLSCSDKIARWNMVGIQGCMLASLIDPIYLTSIIFADSTPFNRTAMERALWKRFTHAENIIAVPFRFHQPNILIASNKMKFAFTRNEKRVNPSSNSIIFAKLPQTMRPIEVGTNGKRQGITKKQVHTRKSHLRISKVELFSDYMNILERDEELKTHLYGIINFNDLSYKDVKTLSSNKYFVQWKRLREQLLPKWTSKNEHLMNFKAFPIQQSSN